MSKPATAQQATSPSQNTMGPNESAVIQLFARRDPDGDFAVQCEQARVMARILDNADYAPMHAAALKAQNEALKCLEGKRKKLPGRVAVVSSMTAKYREAQ